MSRKLEHLLREWGSFNIRHMEHHLEFGENILYRAGIMGGRVQDPGDGHKILCPDMPRHLQAIDIALHKIDPLSAKVVKVWYCAPPKPDGEHYTMAQLALLLRMTSWAFEQQLNKGRNSLKGLT